MDYISITQKDREKMLRQIGVTSINDLTKGFKPLLNSKELDLGTALSEMELVRKLRELSERNKIMKYFVGAGSYHHYIPAAIDHLIMRGEFLTGYTPYQAEMNQGTLQAIYEFQSYICLLTGMDISNASLYDGSTALAEAALLSCSFNNRNKVVIKDGIHPQYVDVLKTYCEAANLEIVKHDIDNSCVQDRDEDIPIVKAIDESTACIIAQNPDFYGNIENLKYIADMAHKAGALFITCVLEPTCLSLFRPPGSYGADIVVGEGQSFGIPINFGGPYLGLMAVRDFLLKKIPGRISGLTQDSKGNKGFVLTLQAREQHIRRERATSNITTNVALMALASTIYLALMGRTGLSNIASISFRRAHMLHDKLKALGFTPLNKKPFYNEFTMRVPSHRSNRSDEEDRRQERVAKEIFSKLAEYGVVGGLEIGGGRVVICCTEMNLIDDIKVYETLVKDEVMKYY